MKIKEAVISIIINAIIMALLIEYNIFETQDFVGKVIICFIVVILTKILSGMFA